MQTQCKILAIGVSQFVNRIMGTQDTLQPLLPMACPRPVLHPLKEVVVVTPPPSPETLKKPHMI